MTQSLDDVPHADSLRCKAGEISLTAMARSTKDANLLSQLLKDQLDLRIYVENYAEMLPKTQSYNVIGQLNGTLFQTNISLLVVIWIPGMLVKVLMMMAVDVFKA